MRETRKRDNVTILRLTEVCVLSGRVNLARCSHLAPFFLSSPLRMDDSRQAAKVFDIAANFYLLRLTVSPLYRVNHLSKFRGKSGKKMARIVKKFSGVCDLERSKQQWSQVHFEAMKSETPWNWNRGIEIYSHRFLLGYALLECRGRVLAQPACNTY